ncbi:NADP-reducing hydrogenase subunit HndA [bacterium BMS3Bbin06]|nr:NADP-reducing hydrogenase subunit HndA [bacterium BMS3Abin08]GBE35701.1 NADP-reducing hydrogenase subunit HndA [bacterium BMS3Bbin06]HDO36957.1 response regulator [Nitrospirota bacterium]HDY72036.1 response regulator [Nitrospirota bacterium]
MPGSILIVDDESVVIKSCERVLIPEGYNVSGVTGVAEAMEVLKNGDFDIVVTDLKMPGIDGLELIRWIRNNNSKIGIVVITGYPSQESIKDALELGIIDYLPKPFSPQLLIDVTEKAITAVRAQKVEEKPLDVRDVEKKLKEIMKVIDKNRNKPGALIPVLQQTQEIVGYLPPPVQRIIARELNIPVSQVHGVVSFYSFFTMKPKGKHNVRVCLGTACYVKRATEILEKLKEHLGIEAGGITDDKKFSLETVRCLGACGLAPVVVVDHDTHGSVDPVKVSKIIDQYN